MSKSAVYAGLGQGLMAAGQGFARAVETMSIEQLRQQNLRENWARQDQIRSEDMAYRRERDTATDDFRSKQVESQTQYREAQTAKANQDSLTRRLQIEDNQYKTIISEYQPRIMDLAEMLNNPDPLAGELPPEQRQQIVDEINRLTAERDSKIDFFFGSDDYEFKDSMGHRAAKMIRAEIKAKRDGKSAVEQDEYGHPKGSKLPLVSDLLSSRASKPKPSQPVSEPDSEESSFANSLASFFQNTNLSTQGAPEFGSMSASEVPQEEGGYRPPARRLGVDGRPLGELSTGLMNFVDRIKYNINGPEEPAPASVTEAPNNPQTSEEIAKRYQSSRPSLDNIILTDGDVPLSDKNPFASRPNMNRIGTDGQPMGELSSGLLNSIERSKVESSQDVLVKALAENPESLSKEDIEKAMYRARDLGLLSLVEKAKLLILSKGQSNVGLLNR